MQSAASCKLCGSADLTGEHVDTPHLLRIGIIGLCNGRQDASHIEPDAKRTLTEHANHEPDLPCGHLLPDTGEDLLLLCASRRHRQPLESIRQIIQPHPGGIPACHRLRHVAHEFFDCFGGAAGCDPARSEHQVVVNPAKFRSRKINGPVPDARTPPGKRRKCTFGSELDRQRDVALVLQSHQKLRKQGNFPGG
jgi:hypothetical protein